MQCVRGRRCFSDSHDFKRLGILVDTLVQESCLLTPEEAELTGIWINECNLWWCYIGNRQSYGHPMHYCCRSSRSAKVTSVWLLKKLFCEYVRREVNVDAKHRYCLDSWGEWEMVLIFFFFCSLIHVGGMLATLVQRTKGVLVTSKLA